MGQSRHNPRSPAYRGELPKVLIGGTVKVSVEANAEFMIKLGLWQNDPVNAGQSPPEPTEAECDCVYYLTGSMTIPSALFRNEPNKWPTGEAQMGEMDRVPYLDFVRTIQMQHPHLIQTTAEAEPDDTKPDLEVS